MIRLRQTPGKYRIFFYKKCDGVHSQILDFKLDRNIFTRSNLAADCLDNISRCIAFVMLSSEAVNEIVCDEMRLAIQLRTVLRHTLRPCILIPSLIEIGVNIEELYITNCNTSKGASAQQNNSCLRFSEWEKRLW